MIKSKFTVLSGFQPVNEWSLLTLTFDGEELKLYLNEDDDAVVVIPHAGTIPNIQTATTIGMAYLDSKYLFFKGCIDDVSKAMLQCALCFKAVMIYRTPI